MKKLAACLTLMALLTLAFLPVGAQMNKYSNIYLDSFDTVIQLIGYAESDEIFAQQSEQVHQMYIHLHKLFDTYNSYENSLL